MGAFIWNIWEGDVKASSKMLKSLLVFALLAGFIVTLTAKNVDELDIENVNGDGAVAGDSVLDRPLLLRKTRDLNKQKKQKNKSANKDKKDKADKRNGDKTKGKLKKNQEEEKETNKSTKRNTKRSKTRAKKRRGTRKRRTRRERTRRTKRTKRTRIRKRRTRRKNCHLAMISDQRETQHAPLKRWHPLAWTMPWLL